MAYILQFWLETDKAAYLLRQYFFNNLHDRLSTRPFLSLVEKKWLAFQVNTLYVEIEKLYWYFWTKEFYVLLESSCFMQWNRATIMEFVMVSAVNKWALFRRLFGVIVSVHGGQTCNFFRGYQVWECAGHILELAISCWFCIIQAYLYPAWWSLRFLIFLWHRRKKALLSCTRGLFVCSYPFPFYSSELRPPVEIFLDIRKIVGN